MSNNALFASSLAAIVAVLIALAWRARIARDRGARNASHARDPRLRRAMRAREAGRPREALEAAQALARAHPDRIESERWLARAERAAH